MLGYAQIFPYWINMWLIEQDDRAICMKIWMHEPWPIDFLIFSF
jgi:hypothetical protein